MKYLYDFMSWLVLLAVIIIPSADTAAVILPWSELQVKRQVEPVSVSPVPDHFTPHAPPLNWIGLGDSYTASPGTGEDLHVGCARNVGSYVVQLENDFPFTETNDVDFIACSGYVANDVLEKTIPDIKQDSADFMVMSLGGNDIGFSKIAIYCLITQYIITSSCQKVIQEAQNQLESVQLQNNIHSVYDRLFDKMKDDRHYQLYHIFYSRFFDATDPWCDSQTFRDDPIGKITGIKLTKSRRQLLNDLTDALNARLEEIAVNYIRLKVGRASWAKASRLITINPDKISTADGTGTYGLFDGHRFCEPGVRSLENDNVWFFGVLDHEDAAVAPAGTVATQRTKRDEMIRREQIEEAGRLMHEARANNNGSDEDDAIPFPLPPQPESLIQSFHPKTKGMTAVKSLMQTVLQRERPAEK
ncbi:uncharacterized protein KY384_008961 [Bacidia gigantensis]|uniref:uncharacterized protein n=1 Tax=Bacidia gigantensis TaxID=2732470 RepID=UPI001D055E07|nr:uncharacterized protein KY384_008961 [Bacidia gigantensis]KAG8525317.1 hypothetical protein KY384_008961 [Bacidia gigantensis]